MKRFILSAEEVEENVVEDEFDTGEQEFTSERTSINSGKLPAIFHLADFSDSELNLDYGGGKFDNATEYLADMGVENVIYDPYNRTKEHNSEALRKIKENGGADTATLSNVLNVIKEPSVRNKILQNLKRLLKPGGTLYITVYEGSGSGEGSPTKSGYQLNKKTSDYLEEIQEVFPDAIRKGKLIVCTNSDKIQSSEDIGPRHYLNSTPTKVLLDFADYVASKVNKTTGGNLRCIDAYIVDYNRLVLDYEDWEDEDDLVSQSIIIDPQGGTPTAEDLILEYGQYAISDLLENIEHESGITSSKEVTGMYEPEFEPPEYDEPFEYEDVSEKVQIDLDDVVIIVDDNGEYDYEDKELGFLPDTLDFLDIRGLSINDIGYIAECLDEVLYPVVDDKSLPEGRYKLKGYAELSFDFSNIKEFRNYYGEDDWETEGILEDEVETDFDKDASKIEVEFIPIN